MIPVKKSNKELSREELEKVSNLEIKLNLLEKKNGQAI